MREAIRIEKIEAIGEDKVPARPNVVDSDAIIIVEGRADVINLLKYGIKNAVAVEGTNVPETMVDLSDKKTATAFLDGDRGRADPARAPPDRRHRLRRVLSAGQVRRGHVPEGDHQGPPEQDPGRVRPRTVLCRGRRAPRDTEGHIRKQRGGIPTRTGIPPAPEEAPKEPSSLRNHLERVSGRTVARFLSADFGVLSEVRADEIQRTLDGVNGQIAGVVADTAIDQRLLDRLVGRGVEFVAARDFSG